MKATPQCPLCDANAVPTFYAGEHRMFMCTSCRLTFVYPLPDDAFLREFYSRFHTDLGKGGGYELFEDRMSADFAAKIARVRAALPDPGARVLDVGCGKGFFVKTCQDSGLHADGIDISQAAVRFATTNLGVNAVCGSIEDPPVTLAPYDAVTFWATIEHLRTPLTALLSIKKILKPGGHLFLDTGIGNDWLDRLLPGHVQWYDPPQHLYVFSQQSLSLALRKAGFRVETIDTCFERSVGRRLARIVRGFACAVGLRTVAELTRAKQSGPFAFTRFPLGNLMSVVARSEQAD